MNLERRFRVMVLLNVLTSLVGFALSAENSLLFAPVVLLALGGWWFSEGKVRRGVPRWATTGILVLALVFAVVRAWVTSELVTAFTEFLAAIIVLKMWEKRDVRDYGQLLTLALFMGVGATLSNNNLAIGTLWAVQFPMLVVGVMLYQLYSAQERVRRESARSVPASALMEVPLRTGPFAAAAAAVVVCGMLISVGVFLVIPRGLGVQDWGLLKTKGQRITGFTEEVEPGAGSLVSQSAAAVLEVRLERDGKPAGGPGENFYLRGAVLDWYDDAGAGTWRERVLERGQRVDVAAPPGMWAVLEPNPPDNAMDVTVSVLKPTNRDSVPIFSVFRPYALWFAPRTPHQTVSYDPKTARLHRAGEGRQMSYTVHTAQPPRNPARTERVVPIGFNSRTGVVKRYAERALQRAGVEPDQNKRPLSQDAHAVRVLETYLRANYTYEVTDITPPLSVDSTEWFLETNKRGHCEYFASALASMCLAVGIEARVVAGYLVNEYDTNRDLYVVRESDAHAWVEADTGMDGWQVFDATPVSTAPRIISDNPFSRLALWGNRILDFWNTNVVAFSQVQQERLIGQTGHARLADLGSDLGRWIRGARRGTAARFRTPRAVAEVVGGLVVVGIAGRATLVWWRRRKKRSKGVEYGWAMDGPEKRLYRRLVMLLEERGHRKPGWEPPLVYLRRVRDIDAPLAAGAQRVVDALYAARFGGEGAAAIALAKRELKSLAADAA